MENERYQLNLEGVEYRASVFSGLNWDAKKIKQSRIMVIGSGALGNEVLKNLALIGVQEILIVDFDIIERTNLAKSVLFREEDCSGKDLKVEIAKKRVLEINPEARIMTINGDVTIDVGMGIFRRMDAVITCVDNRLTRMWVNRFCHWLDRSWVEGGIEDLGGQITVYTPGKSCYECNLSEKAIAQIRYRNSCLSRAKRYASAGIANTTPVTASIIGAMQVQEALKLIVDPKAKNILAGKQFFYEGLSNTYLTLNYSKLKDRCESHQRIEPALTEAKELTNEHTVGEALQWIQKQFDDPEATIQLPYMLVLEIATGTSEQIIPFIIPRPHLKNDQLRSFAKVPNEDVRIYTSTSELNADFPEMDIPLSVTGIPALHILTVLTKGEKKYVELTGDESFLSFN